MNYESIVVRTEADRVGVVTLNRPKQLNALNNQLMDELGHALKAFDADERIGCLIVTGSEKAFAAGADIGAMASYSFADVYKGDYITRNWEQIRQVRKPVIAAVSGFALGGGCELAMMCDFIIAADNARFGQTGPNVGSFDGGFGASYLARVVGQKKAREIWFLCDQYDAQEALDMGLVNKVVPLDKLEETTVAWCHKILQKSPLSLRMLKSSFNAELDGQAGIQELAGNATLLYYLSDEAKEGREAFMEKRQPDFSKFPKFP